MAAAAAAASISMNEQVFGWMVHAMVFAGDDPATIWGDDHDGHRNHGDHRP
jgi:hypothetical protein